MVYEVWSPARLCWVWGLGDCSSDLRASKSCSLNSLKGGYVGDYIREYDRGLYVNGDARSLDYSSTDFWWFGGEESLGS